MKKKLITALIAVLILLAAAVSVLVYMNNRDLESKPVQSVTDGIQETTEEPTEETVGISLPTENPDEVSPEITFPDVEMEATEAPTSTQDPDATEDSDENATPELDF